MSDHRPGFPGDARAAARPIGGEPAWFEDYSNIILLTAWLATDGREAHEVAYAVEKPWKFEEEFRAAVRDLADSRSTV